MSTITSSLREIHYCRTRALAPRMPAKLSNPKNEDGQYDVVKTIPDPPNWFQVGTKLRHGDRDYVIGCVAYESSKGWLGVLRLVEGRSSQSVVNGKDLYVLYEDDFRKFFGLDYSTDR